MAFIISDATYNLSEADINTNTGIITDKGPISVPNLVIGTVVIGVAYDSTIPGWRLLVASPQ